MSEANKKISVNDFVKGYKRLTSAELIAKYVEKHVVKTYAPLLMKKEVLSLMCERSVVNDDIKHIDMTLNKLNMTMAILALYTDIEIEKDEEGKPLSWEAYDELKSSGVLEVLIAIIGDDIQELLTVQKEVLDTWHMKNTSTEAYIMNLVEFVSRKFGVVAGAGMGKLSDVLDNEEKMNKVMELGYSFIKKIKKN